MKILLLLIAILNLCSPAVSQVESRILGLADGDTLPSELVNENNLNEVARSLVERLSLRLNVPKTNDLYDFRNDTTILIQFKEDYIKSISRNCFRNLHQTNHSGGSTDSNLRAELEDHLIGLKLEDRYKNGNSNIINHLRPKYAYVMLKKLKHKNEQSSYLPQYGNVFAVLKDDIKERSTFTPSDSLNTYLQGDNNQISVFQKSSPLNVGFYYEAQIWGKTCFSDVDHFLINCPGMKPTSARSKKLLMKQGISVFQCTKDDKKRLGKAEEEMLNKKH